MQQQPREDVALQQKLKLVLVTEVLGQHCALVASIPAHSSHHHTYEEVNYTQVTNVKFIQFELLLHNCDLCHIQYK